jgi:arylsulfatase A-like enzyme
VILIVLDACRADHLGIYGYNRQTTPNMDAFAGRSVIYTRAYSQAPWTIPSIATLFVSQYPYVHRVNSVPEAEEHTRLDKRFVTLAEALKVRGYRTAGVTSQPWLRADMGFADGFDVFDVATSPFHPQEPEVLNRRVITWLRKDGEKNAPFFLYLHTMGPHAPYHTRPPFDGMFATREPSPEVRDLYEGMRRGATFMASYMALVSMAREGRMAAEDVAYLRARYDEKLAAADHALGELLAFFERDGLLEQSIVIITADHGEAFNEHSNLFHSQTIYREDVRVPLIIYDPRRPWGGGTVDSIAGLIDLYPTIMDLLDLPAPPELSGRSLVESARGTADQAVARTDGPGGYKLITDSWSGMFEHGGLDPVQVYDLRVDPGELHPLDEPKAPGAYRLLREAAAAISAEIQQRDFLDQPETRVIDEQLRQQLESLGYLR